MERYSTVIIGAGPTGLGAAHRLLERGESDFLLLERQAHGGGLASSFVDEKGFTWDLGSHLQFSHYDWYDRLLDVALPPEQWIEHRRHTAVWLDGDFIPYPFQYNLHRLPPSLRWECLDGLLNSPPGVNGVSQNFAAWIDATFGHGIARLFMVPYNEKIWATPLAAMSASWIRERVAVPDLREVMRGICLNEDHDRWGPNATFRYPLQGGTGAIWRSLAGQIPGRNQRFNCPVESIDLPQRVVRLSSGACIGWDRLLSTVPLDELASRLQPAAALPDGVQELRFTATHVFGFGVEGALPADLQGMCWLYFPQPELPFYRVTVFSNLSPHHVPDAHRQWSLMVEVAESDWRPVTERIAADVESGLCSTGLVEPGTQIISRWRTRLTRGYPVPTASRDGVLNEVLPWLQDRGIWSRGRFGAWKYEVSNQDHSVMQGVEAVENMLDGREEFTAFDPDLVNSRRNAFPFPEWTAGSAGRPQEMC